jgi:hypothetical protein
MKLDSVGTLIAWRDLELNEVETVRVKIGMPQEFPEGEGYYCPFEIAGLSRDKIFYAGGVDPVQALELALQNIGAILYTSAEYEAGKLRYLGGKNLRFPVADSIIDLVPKS